MFCISTLGCVFDFYSIKASVNEMKLDSTPLPDFAEASKTDRPVRFVNSWMSSSETCRSGSSVFSPF